MMQWIGILGLLLGSCAVGAQTAYAPNGGVFTPKGTLRVLLVFVASKDQPTSNPRFSNGLQALPTWANPSPTATPDFVHPETGAAPPYLFATEKDFLNESRVPPNFYQKIYLNIRTSS